MIENLTLYFFTFFFPFHGVSAVCEFVKITQVIPVYRFGRVFFLIELEFFLSSSFFLYSKKNYFKRKFILLKFIKYMNMFTSLAS